MKSNETSNDTNFEFSGELMFLNCSMNSFLFFTAYSDRFSGDNNFASCFEDGKKRIFY